MKRFLSFVLCFVMLFTDFYVFASSDNVGSELSDFDYALAVIAKTMEINKTLEPIGLTADDLSKIPVKDDKFCEELKQIVIESSKDTGIDWKSVFDDSEEEGNDGKMSEEAKVNADLWGYAWKMAELNKKRDRRAKDISTETKYMFMSHFVDIRTGPEFVVNPKISNDFYFSAWITDDDRQAYDKYLKGANQSALYLEMSDFAVNTFSGVETLRSLLKIERLGKAKNVISKTVDFLEAKKIREDLKENFDNIKELLANKDDPKVFVENMRETLEFEKYDKISKEILIDAASTLICAACVGGENIFAFAVGSQFYLFSHLAKDIYDKAWWTALILHNRARVSARILRRYGI